MRLNDDTLAQAANTLRAWALDEDLKERVLANPAGAALAGRVAQRYTAGPQAESAVETVRANALRGHLGSIECAGESVRSAEVAAGETAEFVRLAALIGASELESTVSFDLSHIGSLVDAQLGLSNALELAAAAQEAGTYLMISAEGSDRTDLVLDLYECVSDAFPSTGITLQARLHRSLGDLERVMARPGPVRLVKGAFLEAEDVAYPRDAEPMTAAYLEMATRLVKAGHRVNLATHDAGLVASLQAHLGEALKGEHVEFEMLQGLGTELLDSLHRAGYATREYVVYGPQWWLYVLNRMAEHPERAIQALADLRG